MSDQPQIERSIELGATCDDVWEKIIDGDLAEEWMGVRVEPRMGGRVVVPHKEIIGTVEEVDPGRSITWTWREPDGDPSQVTIELDPTDAGTRVTITERLLEYRITRSPTVFLARAA